MYKNFIFDLYGTLIDIRTDEETAAFWDKVTDIYAENGASYIPSEIRNLYHRYCREEVIKEKLRRPYIKHFDIDICKVFTRLYRHKGVKPSKDLVITTARRFRKASTKLIRLYHGVNDLLNTLKGSGCRIYLLTNAQRAFTLFELSEMEILHYFDGMLISSDTRIGKPEKAFFDKLINKYHLDKSKTVMIGNDKINDALGAKNAGIDCIYIHQEISTPLEENEVVECVYAVLDGDFTKIKDYLFG